MHVRKVFQKWGGMQQTPIATSHKEVLQTWYSGKYRLSGKYGLAYVQACWHRSVTKNFCLYQNKDILLL
jgi:hypothetical protein